MGKRGEINLLMYTLLEVALIFLFIASCFIILNSVIKDQTYYQRVISKDLALAADAMQASDGEFMLFYSYSTPKKSSLDMELSMGEIYIYPSDEGNSSKSGSRFLFGYNNRTNISNHILFASDISTTQESKIFSLVRNDDLYLSVMRAADVSLK